MQALTELELRRLHTSRALTVYPVPAGTLVTPAAMQYAKDHGIELQWTGAGHKPFKTAGPAKPEDMTHLYGDTLVPKTHPRIRFRGRVDSLQAQVLTTIIEARTWGIKELGTELEGVLQYLRELIKAEVTGKPLPDLRFRDWTMDDIREKSQGPDNYFGLGHLFPSPDHGLMVARLNVLRTLCRETELAGVEAFFDGTAVERQDLVRGLNRLNSLFYIMMIMLISGHYQVKPV